MPDSPRFAEAPDAYPLRRGAARSLVIAWIGVVFGWLITGEFSPLSVAVFALLFWKPMLRWWRVAPPTTENLFSGLIVIIGLAILGRLQGDLFLSMMHALFGLVWIVMRPGPSARTMVQLSVLNALLITAAAAVTTEFVFLPPLILFLAGQLAGYSLVTAYRGRLKMDVSQQPTAVDAVPVIQAMAAPWRRHWLSTGVMLLFAMVMCFLSVPRLAEDPWRVGWGGMGNSGETAAATPQGVSGFSEEMTLSGMTGVTLDETIVARVTVLGAFNPGFLQLRAFAMSDFDGMSWKRNAQFETKSLMAMYFELARESYLAYFVTPPEEFIGQISVQLEKSLNGYLLFPVVPLDITPGSASIAHDPAAGAFRFAGELKGSRPPRYVLRWAFLGEEREYASIIARSPGLVQLMSDMELDPESESKRIAATRPQRPRDPAATPVPPVLRGRDLERIYNLAGKSQGAPGFDLRGLDIPPDAAPLSRERVEDAHRGRISEIEGNNLVLSGRPGTSSRLRALAHELKGTRTNSLEIAQAVIAGLRARCEYSLNWGEVSATNPVESFLFDTKRGHCEYFATAMVVILRKLGIPSRIVTGYYTDEFNPITGEYIVRESHAHAWVEVFFPEVGWLPFDPTPPGGRGSARSEANAFMRHLGYAYDALRLSWYRFIVDFNFGSQREWYRWLGIALFDPTPEGVSQREKLRMSLWWLVVLLPAPLAFSRVRVSWFRFVRRRTGLALGEPDLNRGAQLARQAMLTMRAWARTPGAATSRELSARFADDAIGPAMARTVRRYERIRFGPPLRATTHSWRRWGIYLKRVREGLSTSARRKMA